MEYHKPEPKRAWIVWCVVALCVTGIIYAVCASDLSVSVKGAYDVQVKVGDGAKTINVIQVQKERRWGS